jgi:hypothetical protein
LSNAGIRDLDVLRGAAQTGRLRALKGFSEKTEKGTLAENVRRRHQGQELILRDATNWWNDVARFIVL